MTIFGIISDINLCIIFICLETEITLIIILTTKILVRSLNIIFLQINICEITNKSCKRVNAHVIIYRQINSARQFYTVKILLLCISLPINVIVDKQDKPPLFVIFL